MGNTGGFVAYSRGMHDYLFGTKLTQNPFRKGSKDHDLWRQGWKDRLKKDTK